MNKKGEAQIKIFFIISILLILILLATYATSALGAKITPELLAQRFNLRTVFSSYAQSLKMYCVNYPVDFFFGRKHHDHTRLCNISIQ